MYIHTIDGISRFILYEPLHRKQYLWAYTASVASDNHAFLLQSDQKLHCPIELMNWMSDHFDQFKDIVALDYSCWKGLTDAYTIDVEVFLTKFVFKILITFLFQMNIYKLTLDRK